MRFRLGLRVSLAVGVAMLLTVSCGGSASSSDGSSGTSTTVDPTGGLSADPTYFFTLTAESGSLDGERLTLTGVASSVLAVAERPARVTYQQGTDTFVDQFDELFGTDSPNAVLVADGDGQAHSVALTISEAKLDPAGDAITFSVNAAETHDLVGMTFGLNSLTIDSARRVDGDAGPDARLRVTAEVRYPDGPRTEFVDSAPNTRWKIKLFGERIAAVPESVILDGRVEIANETGERLHVTIDHMDKTLFDGSLERGSHLILGP